MTDPTATRDLLSRALDDHPAVLDVEALLAGSRHQGTRLRRRRRTAAGGVALAAVLALGGVAVAGLPGTSGGGDVPVAADPTPTPLTPEEAGRALARGAAAALTSALTQEVAGATTSAYSGQAGPPEFSTASYYAQIELDDGAGVSQLGLNVQVGFRGVGSCLGPTISGCRRVPLDDGSVLQTHEEAPTGSPGRRRSVAVLFRPDGLRISATSNNGIDGGDTWQVTRPEPALDVDQLARIVQRDFWQLDLPQRFLDAGQDLEPFTNHADVGMSQPN